MTRHGNSRHEPRQDIQVSRQSQDRDMINHVSRQDTCLDTPSLAPSKQNYRKNDSQTIDADLGYEVSLLH